ncbi:MAG: M50 family metallopeptidase [Patescibacteria group bacterium]
MFFNIFIILLTLIFLAAIHEFGHFIFAKRSGVVVEEFGIGYPPRIFGKKMGDTFYSLNWLPFGAFIKIEGEESIDAYKNKTIGQRALMAIGGPMFSWLAGVVLLAIIFLTGTYVAIPDEIESVDARVQITAVSSGSPAESSGLKAGDIVVALESTLEEKIQINKIIDVQEFIEKNKGKEVIILIERANNISEVSLIPRINVPIGEGSMVVSLTRTTLKKIPFRSVFYEAFANAIMLTKQITLGFIGIFQKIFSGKSLTGVAVVGPIGIGSLANQAIETGIVFYLQFVAIITIHLAIFNLLPIPALDGGKILFLGLEKINKRPLNSNVEEKINSLFFMLLIILMVIIAIKDIIKFL